MFLKDADSDLDYAVDWSEAMAEGEQLSASAWRVWPEQAGGVLASDGWLDGARAGVRLQGGQAGHLYRVGNRVTFADGRIDERSLTIRVEER